MYLVVAGGGRLIYVIYDGQDREDMFCRIDWYDTEALVKR